MAWSIERRTQHVALVTMNTNKANAQNPTFFDDLHRAFDRLEAEFKDCGVVLTGTGRVFSAGLDFDYHFPLFARRSIREVDAWFEAYRATNLRVFTYPRPTVAAINGHAYAGGLILRSIAICVSPQQAICNSLSTRCPLAYPCLLSIARSSSTLSALHRPAR